MLILIVDPRVIQDYPALSLELGCDRFMTARNRTDDGRFADVPFNHRIPDAGYFVVRDCGDGNVECVDGPLTQDDVAAIPASAVDANAATLRDRLRVYLETPSDKRTPDQREAALTALIRIALGVLDSTAP